MLKLNLARNCLKYLIRIYNIKEIYLPYYSCKVLWQACRQENCKVRFYHIGNDFLPITRFNKKDFVLYINYYGLCSDNCKNLAEKYPNLIVDNTQAFYSESVGLASFNSLRKFFNVQNGAYLYTKKELKLDFSQDKYLFFPCNMAENYEQFLKNELFLNTEDIKYLAPCVEEIMKNIDFEQDKKTRIEKFLYYQEKYKKVNKISLSLNGKDIPYCYPLCTTDNHTLNLLSSNKTPLLSLWGTMPENVPEYKFLNNTVVIPLV